MFIRRDNQTWTRFYYLLDGKKEIENAEGTTESVS